MPVDIGSYNEDRVWSDQYIPAIKAVVGPHLLVQAPIEIDREEAADLMVLRARDMTIAARVRRPGYADSYPYDFTLRCKRDSGAKTELTKLFEGWGDWMFYGHASSTAGQLARWWLIDLHKWRHALLREGYRNGWKRLATERSNGDGTHFMAFDLRAFDASIIVASSHTLPTAKAA